ncbi:MAG TPA: VWA domain-containing protein [Actinomycetes bacterium]|nr:VWA domain-containing protein [Actinomycetes bacterium]
MTFQWPWLLWSLGLIPPLVAVYVLWQRRRVRYAARFTNLDLLANVVPRHPAWRRHLPALLYLLALAALLVSLGRPAAVVLVPRQQATVVLLLDVSGSMNATDVKPSRMIGAQQAARSFAASVPEHFRLGVVAFSSVAQMLSPPTTDREQARLALEAVQAQGGTAMGDAILRGLEAARIGLATGPGGTRPPTVLVLLSDGANTSGRDPLAAAGEARRQGIPVFTVALGTAQGVIELPDRNGLSRLVPVPPDEGTLRQIAQLTGARSFQATDARGLTAIYRGLGTRIGFERSEREVTALFSAAAAVMLLAGGVLALLLLSRFP